MISNTTPMVAFFGEVVTDDGAEQHQARVEPLHEYSETDDHGDQTETQRQRRVDGLLQHEQLEQHQVCRQGHDRRDLLHNPGRGIRPEQPDGLLERYVDRLRSARA